MSAVDSGLSLRAHVALEIGRTANVMSRLLRLGDGTTIGGVTALALDPELLSECTAGRSVVLVSGTNGKTTTTRMLLGSDRVGSAGEISPGRDEVGTGAGPFL